MAMNGDMISVIGKKLSFPSHCPKKYPRILSLWKVKKGKEDCILFRILTWFDSGWLEFTTHRFLMIDMTEMENKVPLDGIGSTCILTRASVHREGINFPAFPFRHHIDTEGFAKAAAAAGYTVYGLPAYRIYHTGIPDNGLHEDNL